MNKSKIEWTETTWNPVTGCTPISEGCQNCYAARYAKRGIGDFRGDVTHGDEPILTKRDFSDVRLHSDRLEHPLHWRKPRKIFVCSMGDLFHENVPDEFIAAIFAAMSRAPQHVFQVLTKRPARMRQWLKRCGDGDTLGWITHDGTAPRAYNGLGIIVGRSDQWPLPNVWLGVSCENQAAANERIPMLMQTPAAVRFVSVEPMLGPVNLTKKIGQFSDCPECGDGVHVDEDGCCYHCGRDVMHYGANWVICGCESGPGRRPAETDWIRSVRDQCSSAEVPFFLKQMNVAGALVKMPKLDGLVWAQMPLMHE
jgi:protein gp37